MRIDEGRKTAKYAPSSVKENAVTTNRRESRRRERSGPAVLKIPYGRVRNTWGPLEIVSPGQIERIHEASMRILEDVGLNMQDPEALDLWAKAGARVEANDQRIRFDRGLVLDLVARAPRTFTWRALNPARSMPVGGDTIGFGPNGGMAYIMDAEQGRRPGTQADYRTLCKLAQLAPMLHYNGGELIATQDVAVSARHLHRLLANFELTDKPVLEAAHGRVIPQDCFEMLKIAYGQDALEGDPILGGIINVSSPLRYDSRMLGGLISYARAGQITIITPFILAGAMAPISMAAAIAQQNAEALAGIALTQLVRPGAPVIYGGFTTNADMRSGSPAFGTPEGAWAALAGAQLARRYGLPYRGSGSLNTSKAPDAQAAYETAWTMWPVVLATANFVLHSCGWLDGGLSVSLEKYIIDLENLAMFQHFLAGFEVNDDTLALDFIREVGPGGHHFGTAHTQARFTTEFFPSFLADRLGYETWAAAGEWDAARRATLIWKEMLAAYEPPPTDPALLQALRDFVAARERERQTQNLYE